MSGKNGEKASCLVEVFDRSGVKVSESNGKKGTLHLDDVKLWEPLKSYLYTVKVTAGEDVYTLPYGVRTVVLRENSFSSMKNLSIFEVMESMRILSRQAEA